MYPGTTDQSALHCQQLRITVNSDTARSTPYNLARTVTYTKASSKESPIPTHANSCMGGVRTAGDLVAWMQLTRKMKINQAKAYVAQKLDLKVQDLTNEAIMTRVRAENGFSSVIPDHIEYAGIAAKSKIAKVLDIPIRSVNLYEQHMNK